MYNRNEKEAFSAHGSIQIKLANLIEQHGISKNKLSHAAEMQRTQINRYCTNRIARLDLDVLARLCYVFDCEVRDLLEYMPPQQEPNEETT